MLILPVKASAFFAKSRDISGSGISLVQNLPDICRDHELEIVVTYENGDGECFTATEVGRLVEHSLYQIEVIDSRGEFQNLLDEVWG
jgi:hypothetical protein